MNIWMKVALVGVLLCGAVLLFIATGGVGNRGNITSQPIADTLT